MTTLTLSRAAVLGALLAFAPSIALAADTFWKGTWTGAWGGVTPTSVTIGKDHVKKYVYDGEKQPHFDYAGSKVKKTVRFSSDTAIIVIRRTGKNTALATYDNDDGGHSTAELVRR